jgi:hypothetical protein
MKMNCEKHGEVEAHPNENNDVFCPKCLCDEVEKWMTHGGRIQLDPHGYPLMCYPYTPLQISKLNIKETKMSDDKNIRITLKVGPADMTTYTTTVENRTLHVKWSQDLLDEFMFQSATNAVDYVENVIDQATAEFKTWISNEFHGRLLKVMERDRIRSEKEERR